jgi:hypothetical protein
MPSLLTEAFLVNAIVVGSLLSAGLLLVTAGARLLRSLLGFGRARAEAHVRPMVLAVVSGEEPPGGLIVARGARGLAAERLVFAYLAQVRGPPAALRDPAGPPQGALGLGPPARPGCGTARPHRLTGGGGAADGTDHRR